jgi:hypothetical protein
VMTALGLAVPSGYILGQTPKDLVGTWTWASVDIIRADGTKTQPFGANPKGYVIFEALFWFDVEDYPSASARQ